MNEQDASGGEWATNNRQNTIRLAWWTAAWVITMAVAVFGAHFVWESSPWLTLAGILVNLGVGVGMIMANRRHLKGLGRQHQVLCVTHLPAIAACADLHLHAFKEVQGGRTRTTVAVLEGEARIREVADMIAGGADQKTARAEARRLLASPGKRKGSDQAKRGERAVRKKPAPEKAPAPNPKGKRTRAAGDSRRS